MDLDLVRLAFEIFPKKRKFCLGYSGFYYLGHDNQMYEHGEDRQVFYILK